MIHRLSREDRENLPGIEQGLIKLITKIDNFFGNPSEMGPDGPMHWYRSLTGRDTSYQHLGAWYDIFYAEQGGEPIGLMSVMMKVPDQTLAQYAKRENPVMFDAADPRVVYVSTFYVAKEHMRKGIGKNLEESMAHAMLGIGKESAFLKTMTTGAEEHEPMRDLPGIHYYQKSGWQEVGSLLHDPDRVRADWWPCMSEERRAIRPGTIWYMKGLARQP
ncbi:MAG: GNAT family N-acetyltransferase [Nanoarchaeota archaeon]|nr:GNAT family N-acetyltransferase [Nanoarchaeota archaeon]